MGERRIALLVAVSAAALPAAAADPDVFGSGQPAEMTYYVTSAGAHVFAAGAFTLAGTDVRCPSVSRFLENLWDELTNAPAADRVAPATVDLGPCPLAEGG